MELMGRATDHVTRSLANRFIPPSVMTTLMQSATDSDMLQLTNARNKRKSAWKLNPTRFLNFPPKVRIQIFQKYLALSCLVARFTKASN